MIIKKKFELLENDPVKNNLIRMNLNYLKKPLVFAVPGSKVYINNYYQNTPGSFLNISVTGSKCSLLCKHCRGILLKNMDKAETSEELIRLVELAKKRAFRHYSAGENDPEYNKESTDYQKEKNNGGLQGMLISGGFNSDGTLPIENVLEGIKMVKEKNPLLKIFVHMGFVSSKAAMALKESGVDGVLTNIIGSRKAISDIYNLNNGPDDFYNTIIILKNHGLKVSPHIILGIDSINLENEFKAVEKVIKIGVDSLVFAVIKKASARIDFNPPLINCSRIIELIKFTKKLNPALPVSFGCAKPAGKDTMELEKALIETGIDAIAFPSEKTIEYAVKNKIAHTFIEKCCAIL